MIAPWREWDLRSRTDCIAYAQKHAIPVSATLKKPYSMDRNLMHISYEGGILEDPWRAPDEEHVHADALAGARARRGGRAA